MNTYRVSIQGLNEPDQAVCIDSYDVDAMLPSIAVRRVMKVAKGVDVVTVVCRLYASDIYSTNEKSVRSVVDASA